LEEPAVDRPAVVSLSGTLVGAGWCVDAAGGGSIPAARNDMVDDVIDLRETRPAIIRVVVAG
jgi:hypothetical protein